MPFLDLPHKVGDAFDEAMAKDMADALLEECATVEQVNNDDWLINTLRSLNADYELGWSPAIIAIHMDRARQLFGNELMRILEESEYEGVFEPHEYESERLGHRQLGLKP